MVSDGVGSMIMYTPNGKPMPGFDKVVFAKQCSEKLVSIGSLCDAGMVCVFDSERQVHPTGYFWTIRVIHSLINF